LTTAAEAGVQGAVWVVPGRGKLVRGAVERGVTGRDHLSVALHGQAPRGRINSPGGGHVAGAVERGVQRTVRVVAQEGETEGGAELGGARDENLVVRLDGDTVTKVEGAVAAAADHGASHAAGTEGAIRGSVRVEALHPEVLSGRAGQDKPA